MDDMKKSSPVEQWFHLSITEVSHSFGVDQKTIIEIVNEGIVHPKKNEQDQLEFDDEAIRLIRTVLRLNRDLGVNIAGAGLALELMQEIERLKQLINPKDH